MQNAIPDYLTPQMWLDHLFGSQTALRGGVVRRKVRDVERIVGRSAFEAEVRRRGFRAIENGADYIVLCNRLPFRVVD